MSVDERRKLLCDAIRRKCKFPISTARLDFITTRLNLRRTYLIKATSNPTKFLNIATSEHIETADRILLSQVFPLYGQFSPGLFTKTDLKADTAIRGSMDIKQDAAAVKIALSRQPCGSVFSTYTLVLYETGQ